MHHAVRCHVLESAILAFIELLALMFFTRLNATANCDKLSRIGEFGHSCFEA